MDKRFLLFMLLAMTILWANMMWIRWNDPPKQANNQPENKKEQKDKGVQGAKVNKADQGKQQGREVVEPLVNGKNAPHQPAAKAKTNPQRRIALGSGDPESPYRMLVVLNTRGASVEWVGLNSPDYLDLDARFYRCGYLGYLALTDEPKQDGARVNVVGPGSPAASGLKPDDVILRISGPRGQQPIRYADDVREYLDKSRTGDEVELQVLRDDKKQAITLTLGARPLELIQPEGFAPQGSFLLTLAGVEDAIPGNDKGKKPDGPRGPRLDKDPKLTFAQRADGAFVEELTPGGPAEAAGLKPGDKITQLDNTAIHQAADFTKALGLPTTPTGAYLKVEYERAGVAQSTYLHLRPELPGVHLYTDNWEEIEKERTATQVVFRRTLPKYDLQFLKRYRLAKVEKDGGPAYHLTLDVEIINRAGKPREVSYQLDGPQGLPIEGWWYGYKISRTWGTGGTRDVVYSLNGTPQMINCSELAKGSGLQIIQPQENDLDFLAVETRYFAAALRPAKSQAGPQATPWIHTAQPILVGAVPENPTRANPSFRIISMPLPLAAAGADGKSQPAKHSYTLFLGPKEADLLAQPQYQLQDLIYYGWPVFSFVAHLMAGILHMFYWLIPNYGIAIILLTVLVRACMFPLSRKQALGAQKMQQLQPEMKRLAEKYKNKPEQRMKAQRELFRKHNYNPAGGCLLLFIQLPIFIGLYKSLSVDIALRQAPLIPGFYWCSDLSAPDRLFGWANFMPAFLGGENGWLGPYFNILPIITIVLFLVHQKLFMPPPADEQQAMQHKMMKYMMIFFGFMFFKVPSGLCIYFIASSLWGIAERKLLPKMSHETDAQKPTVKTERGKAVTPGKSAPAGREKIGNAPGTNGGRSKPSPSPTPQAGRSDGNSGKKKRRRRPGRGR